MIGHRAIVGLCLLCALVFCAFAAPSASAEGTTAFTCVKAESGAGFSDAHCGKEVASGASFKHEAIKAGTATEIEFNNEKTAGETKEAEPSILIGKILSFEVEVVCKNIKGTGTLTNEEVKGGGAMQVTGSATIEHSECSVPKPSGCKVNEPIVYSTKFTTYQNKAEMGIEFTPKSGSEFGAITYTGEKCGVKGTFGISGAFKGTPGGTTEGIGATWGFNAGTTLKWGGNTYTLSGSITPRMKGGGNPITLTTT